MRNDEISYFAGKKWQKYWKMKIEISYQGGIQKFVLRGIPSPNILKVIILFCMQKL